MRMREKEVVRTGVRDGAPFFSFVAENGQGERVVAQEHAGALRAALLVSAGQRTEHSVPSLSWLVPSADTLPFMQGVLQFAIEIEPICAFLVKQLSAAMSQELMNANLQLESIRFPLLQQLTVRFTAA